MKPLLLVILVALVASRGAAAEETPRPQQFIILLKLSDRMAGKPASAWTKEDEAAVQAHFERLKKMTDTGEVILAGRTTNDDPSGFGIIIVEVANEARAREIMEGDPAVVAGVMKAELYPYRVALIRGNKGAATANPRPETKR